MYKSGVVLGRGTEQPAAVKPAAIEAAGVWGTRGGGLGVHPGGGTWAAHEAAGGRGGGHTGWVWQEGR